jgi:hypothetical protein
VNEERVTAVGGVQVTLHSPSTTVEPGSLVDKTALSRIVELLSEEILAPELTEGRRTVPDPSSME